MAVEAPTATKVAPMVVWVDEKDVESEAIDVARLAAVLPRLF
jgi:hypothetical protein